MDPMLEQDDQVPEDKERAASLARVAALGETLAKKRDEAVTARQQSGVEEDWLEDEEFYEGIDDANRELHRNRSKPLSPEGGAEKTLAADTRSRVFLNITRPYVDAAAAKVADMLLPTDDQNWGLDPTPVPNLINASKDNSPLLDPQTQQQMEMQVTDEQGNVVQKKMTVADQVRQIMDKASEAAKAAENRIDDWLTECNYNAETRKVIEYCARLGTGIIKGPYPVQRGKRAISAEGGLISVVEETVIGPESRCISPWNLYPDPNCGSDIHRGSYTWERDNINKRELRELLDDPSYIGETIALCLEEGPQKKYLQEPRSEKGRIDLDEKDLYDIWYYYGFLDHEDMSAAGCECEPNKTIPALVIMVNDHVIKATLNPLDSGDFPYDVMQWQARDDFWAGIGVARQMRTTQRMLNAGVRQMMENAGLSSGPQIAMRKDAVEPQDGQWRITPRKVWLVKPEFAGPVQEAINAINIPTMQAELMGIVQFAMKMAEDVTGLPMLLQGQQGKAPETVGGMQMLNNNASTVMRRIARTFDDCVTEPHIRRYYDWLLLDPDVPSSEKGDFKIVARGSSALVERDLQNQAVGQVGGMVNNPQFGINPKKWVGEWFKSQRLDPRLFQYTEDEQKRIDEQNAKNPPVDPAVQVAQIRMQAELEKAKINQQDREAERQAQLQIKQLELNIEMMRLANDKDMQLADIKKELTKVGMQEKNKRDIFNAEAGIKAEMGSGI